MKTFAIIAFVPFFLISKQQESINSNYIVLEYRGGIVDKPIPIMLFHLDSFISKEETIVYSPTYKVNKCEFLTIKNAIESSDVSIKIDTTDIGYYNFIIVNNRKKSCYMVNNKSSTKILFDQILSEIPKFREYKSVKYFFESIAGRIN